MNFSICRTRQSFACFQKIQCSNLLMKKFSTKVYNNIRSYGNHNLFTQKIPSYHGFSNLNKINLSQPFAINKMCRSITTIQNNTDGTVEIPSPSLPQEVIAENIDSVANSTDIIEPATSDTVVETALKIGDFKAMGLANFTPVGIAEGFLEFVHVSTGLPWWGTIALATIVLRLGFFPFLIKSQKNVAKLMKLQPQIEKIMEEIKKARNNGDQYTAMTKTVEMQQLYSSNNLNPLKSLLLPLIQMPFFISFFMALRKMAELPVPGFNHGGILWFKDLTAPDPYMALPILVGSGFILMFELGTDTGHVKSQGKGVKWLFRGLGVTSIFITMELPSSVLLYFFCANAIALAQSIILKNKKFRSYFGIPVIKPRINETVKSKSFMEQWKEWNVKQQVSTEITTTKRKKRKSRLN